MTSIIQPQRVSFRINNVHLVFRIEYDNARICNVLHPFMNEQ